MPSPEAAASPAPSDPLSSDSEDEPISNYKIQYPLDHETMTVVCDIRSTCQLPFDTKETGLMMLRAFVFPTGRFLNVPNEPGKYAVSGDWRSQWAMTRVHFSVATKRPSELLVGWVDFGILSAELTGVFVVTLQLPLSLKRNLFNECARFTKIFDVAGFSDIDTAAQPWCRVLAPALKLQAHCASNGITSVDAMRKFVRTPLEARLSVLATHTRKAIDKEVEGMARQDARLATKTAAMYEARVVTMLSQFVALPASNYDVSLKERIISLPSPTEASWLKTPVRLLVADGKAEFKRTSLRVKTADPSDTPQPVRRTSDSPKATQVFSDVGSDSDAAELAPKRARKGPVKFSPKPKEKAPTPNPKKQKGVTKPKGRPATYDTAKKRAADALKKAAEMIAGKEKEEKDPSSKSQVRVRELEARVRELEAQLQFEAQSKAIAVQNAELNAVKSAGKDLLLQYRKGLAEGSALACGKGGVNFGSPFSFGSEE